MHLCDRISVTLKNEPLDSHPEAQGTYLLANVKVNEKPMWLSDSHVIWYNINKEQWVLGLLQNLGNERYKFSGRSSEDKLLMPCEENFWRHHNMRYKEWQEPSGYGLHYDLNSINIQCRGNSFFRICVQVQFFFKNKFWIKP